MFYIFTYGRHDKQITYNNLPKSIRKKTKLVVQKREAHLYKDYETIVLPSNIETLPPSRQWILDNCKDEKIIMMDDDLGFLIRRTDDPGKFLQATDKDVVNMFNKILKSLDKFAHVGVVGREGGNRVTEDVTCSRMSRILCYRTDILRKNNIKMDRVKLPEDFDITLQLLYKGYENLILSSWAHGQGSSNAPGGCSTYRTIEYHNNSMKEFAKLHPKYVKLTEKTTKTAWGGGTRVDVIIQWKKAYESSF